MNNKKPCMRITLTDEKPSLFDSKAGGLGYVPHDAEIPSDRGGRQLRLLAQLDCSKITLDEFPKEGLLQFWIRNDDVYGMNFDEQNLQDTFRVVYHKEIDRTVTEAEILEKTTKSPDDEEDDWFPVLGEFGMTFAADTDILADPDDEDSEGNFGHKVGGFPEFTQCDPREDMEENKYDFLLFQLDSDYENSDDDRVLWGDCGVGNFFIDSEKLKKLDFSDVLYNWDCY